MANTTLPLLSVGAAVADADLFVSRQGADTVDKKVAASALAAYQRADGCPQNSQSANYTLVIDDAGKHIYHPAADTTPRTITIPANASVAFKVGTVIGIVNENAAGAITLAITTDTLRWGSSTGSRTIAANGTASLLKVTATQWRLTGDGIT